MRSIIKCIVDGGEVFELKKSFGRSAITGLARLDGRTVGIVANNTIHLAGALDADACEKITNFLVLCDSFNIPIIMLVDTPGFMIGKEGERRKVTGKIINFMNALTLMTVPKITIIIRKTYGQAYLNMGGGRNSDTIVAWPTAEISFMAPETGINVVYNIRKKDDPKRFAELARGMGKDTRPYEAAGKATWEDGRLKDIIPAPYVMGLAKIDGRYVAVGGARTLLFGAAPAPACLAAKAVRGASWKTWLRATVHWFRG